MKYFYLKFESNERLSPDLYLTLHTETSIKAINNSFIDYITNLKTCDVKINCEKSSHCWNNSGYFQ